MAADTLQETVNFTELLDNFGTDSKEIQNKWLDNFVFYSEGVVQSTIFSIGIIFNIINIIVIGDTKILHTFRVCLMALTITDLGTCVFAVAQLAVETHFTGGRIPFGYWNKGALTSHVLYFIFCIFACTSSTYVLLIGYIRAYMIAKPHESFGQFNATAMRRVCVGIFFAVTLLFLPAFIYAVFQVCFKDIETPICHDFFQKLPKVENLKYYFYVLSIIFIPCVVIGNIVCFLKIKRAIKKSNRRALRLNKEDNPGHKSKASITRTLLVILLLDTIWIMPYCLQYLTMAFSPEDTIFDKDNATYVVFDSVVEILYSFRPTYNLVVYLLINSEYKQTFQRMLPVCAASANFREGAPREPDVNRLQVPVCEEVSVANTAGLLSKTTSITLHCNLENGQ